MGLAMVHSYVKNAAGFVRVESEVGSGTAIRIYIPAAASDSEVRHAVKHSGQSSNAPF